jgi:hypothetical protein
MNHLLIRNFNVKLRYHFWKVLLSYIFMYIQAVLKTFEVTLYLKTKFYLPNSNKTKVFIPFQAKHHLKNSLPSIYSYFINILN